MSQSPKNRLAQFRKRAGLTQQQLATAVETHWITISKLERGKSKLTFDWMTKLAPILGVTPADLISEENTGDDAEVVNSDNGKAERLRLARQEAGYSGPTEAARAMGWVVGTYLSHENGTRGIKHPDVVRYASAFGVDPGWIEFGQKTVMVSLHRKAAGISALDRLRAELDAAEGRLVQLREQVAEAEKEIVALGLAVAHLETAERSAT